MDHLEIYFDYAAADQRDPMSSDTVDINSVWLNGKQIHLKGSDRMLEAFIHKLRQEIPKTESE